MRDLSDNELQTLRELLERAVANDQFYVLIEDQLGSTRVRVPRRKVEGSLGGPLYVRVDELT